MTIHRKVLKQKNKPFKNSKNKKKVKVQNVVADKIGVNKKLRLKIHDEGPRLIFVVSFHESANPYEFINGLLEYHSSDSIKIDNYNDGYLFTDPILIPSNITNDGIPRRLLFYTCPRNFEDILHAAAAADIILCLFRGSNDEEPAFDELGYRVLSVLRLQGLPTPVGVNLEIGLDGNRQPSNTLTRRYFHSEFGAERKFTCVLERDDLRQVLMSLSVVSIPQLSWRKHRGYLITTRYNYNPSTNELLIYGYPKGLGFSVRHPVHITSFGDYLINKIEYSNDPCPIKKSKSGVYCGIIELQTDEIAKDLVSEVDCLNDDMNEVTIKDVGVDDLYNSLTSLKINKILYTGDEELSDGEGMEMDNKREYSEENGEFYDGDGVFDGEDLSSDEGDLLNYDESVDENKERIEFEKRALEDLSFPDEVDTPVDVPASERFKKYRVLNNIKTTIWDPYESLPYEYNRINEFQNYRLTMNESKKLMMKNFNLTNTVGSFVCLTLSNVNFEDYNNFVNVGYKRVILLSTVLPYERKVTVLNFSVSRTSEGQDSIPSKTRLNLYCGFRRFPAEPIYSRDINVVRGKRGIYERFFHRANNCIASIYSMAIAEPTPVIALDPIDSSIIFHGRVINADPSRIILKRIVLTGYPIRVHRKRAVVRYMFFHPSDIKYFKPAQLYTKRGLRGKILASLGTHGYMKCLFSDYIQPDDIVCLALYKRVYPKWLTDTWTNWL